MTHRRYNEASVTETVMRAHIPPNMPDVDDWPAENGVSYEAMDAFAQVMYTEFIERFRLGRGNARGEWEAFVAVLCQSFRIGWELGREFGDTP